MDEAFLSEHGVAITSKVGQVRFEDAAKDLITDYSVNKKRTLVDLTRRLDQHLTPWCRGRRLATISTRDVRNYIADRLTAGASNASILHGRAKSQPGRKRSR